MGEGENGGGGREIEERWKRGEKEGKGEER